MRVDGTLGTLDGATFLTELDRLEHDIYLADEAAGRTRSAGERRAAAMVEMARRSASTPADAQPPKPQFVVVLGDTSFTHLCELLTGTVIAPDLLMPHLGDAEMEVLLFDGPFTAVATSPARSFPARLRRVIQIRDRHCQHPSGCDVPAADCDVDHIVPWSHGGETSQFNGRLQCRPHNRDSARHDHGATPHPTREVGILDEIRARLRWDYHHNPPDDPDPDDADDEAAA